jgi:hypothetical protein
LIVFGRLSVLHKSNVAVTEGVNVLDGVELGALVGDGSGLGAINPDDSIKLLHADNVADTVMISIKMIVRFISFIIPKKEGWLILLAIPLCFVNGIAYWATSTKVPVRVV